MKTYESVECACCGVLHKIDSREYLAFPAAITIGPTVHLLPAMLELMDEDDKGGYWDGDVGGPFALCLDNGCVHRLANVIESFSGELDHSCSEGPPS